MKPYQFPTITAFFFKSLHSIIANFRVFPGIDIKLAIILFGEVEDEVHVLFFLEKCGIFVHLKCLELSYPLYLNKINTNKEVLNCQFFQYFGLINKCSVLDI